MKSILDSIIDEAAIPEEFRAVGQSEANYGVSSTREKVRWYQAILRIAVADPTVSLNGNHNDPSTRNALRKLQKNYKLKPTSYLTIESNAALTQITLEWIYRNRIANTIGQWGSALTDRIKQFQRDYGLTSDGKVGPLTRSRMVDVLLAKIPTPIKNFHSQLGRADLNQRQTEVLDLISWETAEFMDVVDQTFDEVELERDPSGIHGRDNRRPISLPANIPWRWICRIKIDGLWSGTGVLISPRHVLTVGHAVYSDKNDEEGFRRYSMARSLSVSPAFDGHVLRRNRQFNKRAPFGTWPVDMDRIFMPSCYTNNLDISQNPATNPDCDLAVLTLKNAIGTKKFTTKKTVREKGRKKEIFRDFDPLGYWGIDPRHQIVPYKPKDKDVFRVYTGGYPASAKGIMQHVDGRIDNSRIHIRFILPTYRYTVNLFENRFAHVLDTSPGQSGSPIWSKSVGTTQNRRLIGIVTLAGENFNQGVALTPNFLWGIANWSPQTLKFDGRRLYVRQ